MSWFKKKPKDVVPVAGVVKNPAVPRGSNGSHA